MQNDCVSKKVFSFHSKSFKVAWIMDPLTFGWFIPIATSALTVIIANQMQRRHFMGAMLESQAHSTWQKPYMRNIREVIACDFEEELWIHNFRMTRSTLDELCIAIGPLGAPKEPVSPDKHTVS